MQMIRGKVLFSMKETPDSELHDENGGDICQVSP